MGYDSLQLFLGQEFPFLAVWADVELRELVTIWQPNSFTNPPQFAFCPKLNFLVLPHLIFISGRIALIFENRFAFTSFFRIFAEWNRNKMIQ